MLKRLPILVGFFTLVLSCGKPEVKEDESRFYDDRAIASVGGHTLTLGEVHRKFKDTEFESIRDEYEKKKRYVELAIERFLHIDGARAAGLSFEMDSTAIQGYLFQELYSRDANVQTEAPDSYVKEFFEKYGGEIQFGLLMVKDSVLIDSLYRLLKIGADWDSLVLEYSELRFGKKKGGSVGYVPYGQFNLDIQGKAYDLDTGEYTEPFRAGLGWCIVKFYDRIKHSEKYLDEDWNSYKQVASKYYQVKQTEEYNKRLLKDYDYEIDWNTVDLMIQVSDSVKNEGKLPPEMPGSAYLQKSAFAPEMFERDLVLFRGGGITIEDYINLLESYNPYNSPELKDRYAMESVLKDIATRKIMLDRALELGYDTLQTFKDALKYHEENWLIQEFNKQLCAQIDTATEEDIQKYYEDHPDEFYRPDQVRVSAISLKTEEEALEVLEKLKMGASFAAMAEKYSTDKKSASEGGDLNLFTEKRYTEIYEAARGMDIGEIGGPVEMYGNYWVFKVTLRLTRERRPMHLARSNIRSTILAERRIQAVRSWVRENKENNEYFLDLDLLKNDLGITANDETQAGTEEEIK